MNRRATSSDNHYNAFISMISDNFECRLKAYDLKLLLLFVEANNKANK